MNKTKIFLIFVAAAALTAAVLGLLVSIVERRQEAKTRHFKVADVADMEPDPAKWGVNFPHHYEMYMRTVHTAEMADYSPYGRYGGSEAFSKLEQHPSYKRLFAGYAFAVEYNEERGHMRALDDMLNIKRLGEHKPGACMTCKSSDVPRLLNDKGAKEFYKTPVKRMVEEWHVQHSISCADCHDAATMALRVTRPAFREAMARRGVDVDAAPRQDMRNYVCGQCHVEYYFKGEDKYLTFPWDKGFTVDAIEAYYDEAGFSDWTHAETEGDVLKMQHPEFELWSTGIHARAGVSCVDCHMPYVRVGAMKITDHWIRSPLMNLKNACMTCHRLTEQELADRVAVIQDTAFGMLKRAEEAVLDAQDAVMAARARGADDAALTEALRLHRRALMRWDFISAENSMGFHSPQETMRVLGDAVDFARQSQLAAERAGR
jgi:nitrite reductase (cytochrome c-552)